MNKENQVKAFIIMVLLATSMIGINFIVNLGVTQWWDSLIDLIVISVNVYFIRRDFKKLTLKKD